MNNIALLDLLECVMDGTDSAWLIEWVVCKYMCAYWEKYLF